MIEIRLCFDDIEGVRNFGILLLQNNIAYRVKKEEYFTVFRIETRHNEWVSVIKSYEDIAENMYAKFSLTIGKDNPAIEFRAYALKIY